MNNRDIFLRDPSTLGLENEGVAKMDASVQTLRFELETFVCTGQYAEGLERILASFLERYARSEQANAWVSGFFGSGKSHFVKMLAALWANRPFEDGRCPRDLVPELPDRIRDQLRELDTRTRPDGGTLAITGTLGSAPHDVPHAVLRIVLTALGLPPASHLAQFVVWLRKQGVEDAVRQHLAAQGASFDEEVRSLYVSPKLHEAVRASGVDLGNSASATLRSQFPDERAIAAPDFARRVREVVEAHTGGPFPATLVVLDEVQQSIGDSAERAFAVQEAAEVFSSAFDGRVLFVATGQQALTETPNLTRIAGRFPVKVALSDTDIEAVTRRVVLQKRPEAVPMLEGLFERVAGEVDRHLHGTPFAVRAEDRATLAPDYPILPVRRRFWEALLRVFDSQGTTAQLRSQLRLVHEASRSVAGAPLGVVVGADYLFDSVQGELRNAGQVPREHLDAIAALRGGSEEDRLKARTCALVYLVGKLHEARPEMGLRATPDVLADLLVTDLNEGSAALRSTMPARLKGLAASGLLVEIDGAYRLQTRAGGEWEREFSRRRATYANRDNAQVLIERDNLLLGVASDLTRRVKLTHGASRTPRDLVAGRHQDPPAAQGDRIPVWVRTGWDVTEAEVLRTVRELDTTSPVVVLYLPTLGSDLENVLRDRMAASETITAKGTVTTPEEITARSAMDTRRVNAENEARARSEAMLAAARVWIAGGEEIGGETREAALREAAQRSLVRLFPRFDEADHPAWDKVVAAVGKGEADALSHVGYKGEAADHPVVRAVSEALGSAPRGQAVRDRFRAAPYGWGEDAINAALLVLVQGGLARAEHDGKPASVRDLDRRRIGTATFRREGVTLTAAARLKLRKQLADALGAPVNPSPADEAEAALRFVSALTRAHEEAGGEAPAPERPPATLLRDLDGRVGNDLLAALTDEAFEALRAWKALGHRVAARLPAVQTAQRLAHHAEGLADAEAARISLDAVRTDRALLDDPDPVPPIRQALTAALHAEARRLADEAQRAHDEGEARLNASPVWTSLAGDVQAEMRRSLPPRPEPVPSEERRLLDALDARPLATRCLLPGSIRDAYARLLDEAVRHAAPEATRVAPPPALLRSEGDADAYLSALRQRLLEALAQGPVQVAP